MDGTITIAALSTIQNRDYSITDDPYYEREKMNVKDGGPAFPVLVRWHRQEKTDPVQLLGVQTGDQEGWHEGMTLRDYFAAKIAAGMASDPDITYASIPKDSYSIADAMLMARNTR